VSVLEPLLELTICSEQSNLETDATDEQGPHGPYQYCKDVPIDLVLLAYDAETHRKERAAASTESAECIPVTPVNTQDHETIVSPIAGDTYPASSTWDLAPVPAMALASSPSSFLSPSSLGGDPSVQTGKQIYAGSSSSTTLV